MRYLFLIITLALTSCNTQVAQSIRSNENQHQNLKVKYINGGEFEIYSAQSQMSENPVLTFYLEEMDLLGKAGQSFLMIQHQKMPLP